MLYLVKNGYKVKKIQPVDMFPHTEHVECIVLMSKINQKGVVDYVHMSVLRIRELLLQQKKK